MQMSPTKNGGWGRGRKTLRSVTWKNQKEGTSCVNYKQAQAIHLDRCDSTPEERKQARVLLMMMLRVFNVQLLSAELQQQLDC